MKKTLLKSMLTAVALTLGTTAWAQTDVTNDYLTNADFSQSTPIDNHLCGYSHDRTNNGTPYWGMQDVDGWTTVKESTANGNDGEEGCGAAGAVFAYGSEWQLKGNSKTAPAKGPNDNDGNALGFFAVWGCSGYYYQDVTLPPGIYTLTIPIYNQSGTQNNTSYIGFFPTEGTASTVAVNTAVGKWTTQTVKFTLDVATAGQIRLGYKSNGSGSGANPMLFIDCVKLEWKDVKDAAKDNWSDAKQAAEDALANEAYANIGGSEKANLEAEIAKAEPSTKEGYESATDALKAATATFTAAKASYDSYALALSKLVDLPFADPAKKPAQPAAATDAADAQAKADQLLVALRAYYESNAMVEGDAADDFTSKYIMNHDATDGNNSWTWSGNKNDPRNTESWTDSNGRNDYMYFDGGNWNGTGWTTTMSQEIGLPAGRYLLTAKGRASEGVTLTMSVGDVSVEMSHVGNVGNVFDRGWGDSYIVFESLEGDPITIFIKATTAGNHEWFSVGDFRLMQLESYVVEMADADDYAALDAAIDAAEANTLGFDADEYAPYNNIAALEVLAAAKAINPQKADGNSKKFVTEATEALTKAIWTKNDADVDIVFNGTFATVTPEANYPLGWTRTNGWGQMLTKEADESVVFTTAYYNQPGSLQYGNQGFYLMPLSDKYENYTLSLDYAAREDFGKVFPSILNADGLGLVEYEEFETSTARDDIKHGVITFVIDQKDNYVLTLRNEGNTHMSNVVITRGNVKGSNPDVGIETVSTESRQSTLFNLAGQQVKQAQKGLYIKNGRKYIVK